MRRTWTRALVGFLAAVIVSALPVLPTRAQVGTPAPNALSAGFAQLYNLQFTAARETFQAYERKQPSDPMGPAAEAASYLFEEFNRQGVLTSKFFMDDKKLLGGVDQPADPALRGNFMDATGRARGIADSALRENPRDAGALLALTICAGMQSDYEALIEKKQLASLHFMRESQATAQKLLAIDPNAGDAYVATGTAGYIVACMPGYKRAFLWFDGVHGDKQRSMDQLRVAVQKGRYLQPFAKIMLALGSLREGQPAEARDLFAELTREFPENAVFPRELLFATARANGAKTCNATPC